MASLTGRATSNVKTQLAYASIAQVGVIYLELALGLFEVAVFHMFSHAILRSWQFLRATSVFDDFQEDAEFVKSLAIRNSPRLRQGLAAKINRKMFFLAQNGFLFEAVFCKMILRPLSKTLAGYVQLQEAFSLGVLTLLNGSSIKNSHPLTSRHPAQANKIDHKDAK
jgi:hypothetical protein